MSGGTVESPPDRPASPERSNRPSTGWRVIGVLGEILITIGVLFLLVVVYDLWWTNVVTERQVEQQREELRLHWESDKPVQTAPIPAEAFGLMYIPRLQQDVWAEPLIEGVEDADLAKGIGHFPDSALPGEIGNTAYAGHRATNGQPLANVDQLQVGDLVHIETATAWYTYRLTRDDLVAPTAVWVVDPVPGEPPGTVPTQPILTLLTCHPRWGHTERWIWWGDFVASRDKSQGPPDDVAAILKGQ